MVKYTFDQVKRNVAEIANRDSYTKDFIFELMAAYGRSASAINQLRTGAINKSTEPDTLLQKGVIFFKVCPKGTPLEEMVEKMDQDPLSGRYEPRYIIATDLEYIAARDNSKKTTLDIAIKDIDNEVAFFYGWTGNEINEGSADESAADRRAADKMKDLYDEIERENIDEFKKDSVGFRHDLNVFFSRLLFCYFAEDTGLFKPRQFTNAVKEFTESDGSNLHLFFEELFKSLDSKNKGGMTTPYSEFPYVNGSLFDTKEHNIAIPHFTPTARHILILCADLDWSGVNPDIFGTIFQGIVDETRRDENGMDYTSVPNILKVINPLFMNELHDEFDKAFDSEKKLYALWARISKIKVFDPACGSGNFLIISYKKLRELEHDIIRRISDLMIERGISGGLDGYALASQIKLDHFFGIELEDFPRELAVLSMYIAAHQMNIEFEKEFGKHISIIPLIDMPTIYCDNSARVDWNKICPNNGVEEIYVIGNPPYKGADEQTTSMKSDLGYYFSDEDYSKNIDYVGLWFIKGSRYICNTSSKLAFVTTDSVCQGEHVSIMFPKIFESNIEIGFAYRPFKWSNNATDNAQVMVTVLGLRNISNSRKLLFEEEETLTVSNISPYLFEGDNTIVIKTRDKNNFFPDMVMGSMARSKYLVLSRAQKEELIKRSPESGKFIKKFMGTDELNNSKDRYCIWVEDSEYEEAKRITGLSEIFQLVAEERNKSKASSTKNMANTPYKFGQISFKPEPALIVSKVNKSSRDYIMSNIVNKDVVISDLAFAIYGASLEIFAIVVSRIHMVWAKRVCGKRGEAVRYSNLLGYNTFPCPPLTPQQREKLSHSARNILFARANHPELTLADMYDPDKMPDDLRKAHEENDILVDKLYRPTPFQTGEARLATLFKLYEGMTGNSE